MAAAPPPKSSSKCSRVLPRKNKRLHPMKLRLLLALLCTAALLLVSATAAEAKRKPNVLVILADDEGWGDLRVNGNTDVSTPRIDSLAASGALFERFYVCPVCATTR